MLPVLSRVWRTLFVDILRQQGFASSVAAVVSWLAVRSPVAHPVILYRPLPMGWTSDEKHIHHFPVSVRFDVLAQRLNENRHVFHDYPVRFWISEAIDRRIRRVY